jgi:hypothetical protein
MTCGTQLQSPDFNFLQDSSMSTNNADKKPKTAKPTNKKSPKPTAKKKNAGKNEKKVEPMNSKADLIRKVAGIIKAKGEKPRPTEIVKILAEEGVAVAAAQVSMTLKAAGYRPLRKRRKGKKTAEGTTVRKAVGAGRTNQISMDDLLAAKSVSGAFGGTDKAIAVLQALKQFES